MILIAFLTVSSRKNWPDREIAGLMQNLTRIPGGGKIRYPRVSYADMIFIHM
jgi:hypothetical protein